LFVDSVDKGYSEFRLVKLILFSKFEAYKVDLSITVKVGIGFKIVLGGDGN
jgi:hypothetical protein